MRCVIASLLPWLLFGCKAMAEEPDLARVSWVANRAIELRSINPEDEDFADLEPLKGLVKDARVVLLGEQSHGDGATFHTKTRLIKFLHQAMGFDVLVFESGLYDCHRAWQAFREGQPPREAANVGIFGIWTGSREFQPLLSYLSACTKSDHPLELAGYDNQMTGTASQRHLVSDIRELAEKLREKLGSDAIDEDSLAVISEVIPAIAKLSPYADRADAFEAACSKFERACQTAAESAVDRAELSFWSQLFRSLAVCGKQTPLLPTSWFGRVGVVFDSTPMRRYVELREAQGAENLAWLASTAFAKRKLIVWAASAHIAGTRDVLDPNFSKEFKPLGEGLKSRMDPKQIVTIGFTAYEGERGPFSGPARPLAPAKNGSLEDICMRTNKANFILSLRDLGEERKWLAEPISARPLGYVPQMAVWSRAFDAMVFNRTMAASTPVKRAVLPKAWTGPRQGLEGYRSWVDTETVHGGSASALLTRKAETKVANSTSLAQTFAADRYRGQRIRMAAFVKTEQVEGWAGLWMRVDGQELQTIEFDNMNKRSIQGTSDWKQYEIVLDVPEMEADIHFGVVFRGTGKVWADDFRFEPVGKDVPTTRLDVPSRKRKDAPSANLAKEPRSLDFED